MLRGVKRSRSDRDAADTEAELHEDFSIADPVAFQKVSVTIKLPGAHPQGSEQAQGGAALRGATSSRASSAGAVTSGAHSRMLKASLTRAAKDPMLHDMLCVQSVRRLIRYITSLQLVRDEQAKKIASLKRALKQAQAQLLALSAKQEREGDDTVEVSESE